MLDAPERTGARFSILLFLGFLLTPVIGYGAAVLFGILPVWQLQLVLAGGVVPVWNRLHSKSPGGSGTLDRLTQIPRPGPRGDFE